MTMKRQLTRTLMAVVLILTLMGCGKDSDLTTYSGTYCIPAHDHVLLINRLGDAVNFTLTADNLTLTGTGSVQGSAMTLTTQVGGEPFVLNLVFAADAGSFTGEYTLAGMTRPYNGVKGACLDDYPPGEIKLSAPYVDLTDMAAIHKGFGCSLSGPWEDHSGLDIVPSGNLVPFRAMASGKVVEVNATRHLPDNNWITSVSVKYNSVYRVLYAFENLTPEDADRDIQFANLYVTPGQRIEAGDILGRLHTVDGTYYHVHISLIKNGERICPEPYLEDDARTGLNALIHVNYPDLSMCYPCD
jgi:hypothetical protein